MDKKQLQSLIDLTYRLCGEKETVLLADRVRSMGYGNATRAGISICLDDMLIPKQKQVLLEKALVVTVPGKEFGMDGHLRVSFCGTIKDIMDGVERIKWALDPAAPNELFLGDRKLVRDWA